MAKGRLALRSTQVKRTVPLGRAHARRVEPRLQHTSAELGTLYDRHAGQCFTLALHLLAYDRGAAEDVVHDVFVAAWSSDGIGLGGRDANDTWFLHTTRSACLNRIRRNTATPLDSRRHAWSETDVVSFTAPSGMPPPSSDQVRAALNSLPVQQKEAIELASFQGLTCDRIAQRTGVSVRAVEEHLHAGLRAVRDEFA